MLTQILYARALSSPTFIFVRSPQTMDSLSIPQITTLYFQSSGRERVKTYAAFKQIFSNLPVFVHCLDVDSDSLCGIFRPNVFKLLALEPDTDLAPSTFLLKYNRRRGFCLPFDLECSSFKTRIGKVKPNSGSVSIAGRFLPFFLPTTTVNRS